MTCQLKSNSEDLLGSPLVILGIPFHDLNFEETVAWCMQRISERRPGYVATVNLDFVMQSRKDPELQRILLEADLVVADGMPLVWLSGMFGPKLRERVTGSDLTPLLARACQDSGFSIYALGAGPGVAAKAMQELKNRYKDLKIAGSYSPPKADVLKMDHAPILEKLDSAGPDLILVAFGAPKQEKWINMHFRDWQVPLAVGIGGTLDFLAGVQTRAPLKIQKIGLEWLWRMLSNPRRLFVRYSSNLIFLARESVRMFFLRRPERSGAERAISNEILEKGMARKIMFEPLLNQDDVRDFMEKAKPVFESSSLILDMSKAATLSSLELGALVSMNKACRSSHHRLFLWNTGPRTKEMIDYSGLGEYLGLVKTESELIQKLEKLNLVIIEGQVFLDSGIQIKIHLPLELTASMLAGFRERVERVWNKAEKEKSLMEIDIDASALDFIDSAGLGFLIGLKKKADSSRLSLVSRGFKGNALRTLRLARLDRIFGG